MGWINANKYVPEQRKLMRSIFDSGVRSESSIDFVVIHTAETPEGEDTAEAVGRWFQNKNNTGKGSTHKGVDGGKDDDGMVQYVPDNYVAHGASGGNHQGLHLEIAGKASQTKAQWGDPYSKLSLNRAALLTAEWCIAHNLPLRWLTVDQLRRGMQGITTHNYIRLAFGKTTHTDPGQNFPVTEFMALVQNWHGFIMTLNPAVDKSPSPIAFKVAVVAEGQFDLGAATVYAQADALKLLPRGFGHVRIGTAILVGRAAHDTAYVKSLEKLGTKVVKYNGETGDDTARWMGKDLRRGYRSLPGVEY